MWNCNLTHFDYLVIIQVHSRLDFLEILLDSLITAAETGPDIFVIISTDVHDEALVEIIESNLKHICHTIVYHPYSMAFWCRLWQSGRFIFPLKSELIIKIISDFK